MKDRLNVHLHDGELLAEIDLVGELMIAAAESDEPLGDETIDELLGVEPDGNPSGQPSGQAGVQPGVQAGDTESRPAT